MNDQRIADALERITFALERLVNAFERLEYAKKSVYVGYSEKGDNYEGPYGYGSQDR